LTRESLSRAVLWEANLKGANLKGVNLRDANLGGADLEGAKLNGADLSDSILHAADLSRADLSSAVLKRADLGRALLVETNLENAVLDGCRIYGISAWNVKLCEGTKQHDLVITPPDEPEVTVDNIEVAQFVYLLLHNAKIRDVITIGRKGVLLLGRFTEGRIAVLERLREELKTPGRRRRPSSRLLLGPDADFDRAGTRRCSASAARAPSTATPDSNHALVGRRGAHLAAFDEADQNNLFGDPDIVGEDAAELPSSPAARLVPRWRGSTTRARRRREDRIRKLTLLFGEEATGFPFGRERVCRGRRPTTRCASSRPVLSDCSGSFVKPLA
jgi:hypothetical protein